VLILEESVMLSIRSAKRNDVTLLRTLIQEMAEYEKLPNLITEEALARDGFGSHPAFGALIAEWDGRPAGYAFFFYCYSTFRGRGLFLEDLFVRSQFRSRKVGDALLSRVASIARAQDCFGIMLNVLAWNQPAIKFFQKHHAKFLEDWKSACLDADAVQILTEAK
jgi:GNAT superfamily N-acetyltransferase